MQKYEILEHISDLKIRAFGKDKRELFKNAMIGMQNALRAEVKSQKSKVKSIKIKSLNLNSLLVDFLSEINYLNEVNKEVYQDVKFTKFSDNELEGEIFGKRVKRFGLLIKGVTYHDLDIHQKKDKTWEATILFDI
ncbi:MAG: archease [Patescibacteria group bacterium]|nr:archease [Patescibacteria group bacterium]